MQATWESVRVTLFAMTRTAPWLWLALPLLAGCGKVEDSTEGTAAAAGWSGAAGSSGSGGSGGGGGVAGAPTGGAAGFAPCEALARVGDVVEIGKPMGEGLFPELVTLGSSVQVVFEATSSSGKTIVKGQWLSPWSGPWSAPVVGAAAIFADVNKPFVAAPNTTKTTAAVLHGVAGKPCLRLATIDPQDTLAEVGSCTGSADVGAPRMLVATSSGYVVAYERANYQLHFEGAGGGTASAPLWLGCATTPMIARGWSSPAGAFVAYSTSRPFQACELDAYTDGPPNRLQVARVGNNAELRHELVLKDPIVGLRVAPRADGGAWIVLQTALGVAAGPLRALALDAQGKPLTELVDIVDPGDAPPFAVASMGNRAMLVWYPFPVCKNDPCQSLRFHRLDETAKLSTPALHVEPLPGAPLGSLSLASSPDATSVIAAWHDLKGMPSQVFAARFDCTSPR